MGGQLQWQELVEHTILLLEIEAGRRLNVCGWLGYFLSLIAFDYLLDTPNGPYNRNLSKRPRLHADSSPVM